jgi:hypothetical protein
LAVDRVVLPELVDLEHGAGDRGGKLHIGEVFELGFSGQVRDMQGGGTAHGFLCDGRVTLGEHGPCAQQNERRHAHDCF